MTGLKELIKELEMSQVEFAKEFGLTKSGISEIIAGRTKTLPQAVQLRLFREYNVNPTWLLTGEGGMFLGDGGDRKGTLKSEVTDSEGNSVKKYYPLSTESNSVLGELTEEEILLVKTHRAMKAKAGKGK